MRVTAYARSWSLCVILSDHRIIVPHLNDKWFFFHKLYHPKLLWFIHMVQWYCEILILAHFTSDGTCQILEPTVCVILSDHCIIVPHLNDKCFFFHKLYHPKLLCTGKNNEFPFLDILGYLKNSHKNPKFGKVRQVPTREFPTKFPDWDLSHSSKFGIFVGIL